MELRSAVHYPKSPIQIFLGTKTDKSLDVDAVARFESFRTLKIFRFESFRALKLSNLVMKIFGF